MTPTLAKAKLIANISQGAAIALQVNNILTWAEIIVRTKTIPEAIASVERTRDSRLAAAAGSAEGSVERTGSLAQAEALIDVLRAIEALEQ